MSMCFDEDTCTVMCIKTSKSSVDFNLLANLALDVYSSPYLDSEIDNTERERKLMNRTQWSI